MECLRDGESMRLKVHAMQSRRDGEYMRWTGGDGVSLNNEAPVLGNSYKINGISIKPFLIYSLLKLRICMYVCLREGR
jgi:hypothetical protein